MSPCAEMHCGYQEETVASLAWRYPHATERRGFHINMAAQNAQILGSDILTPLGAWLHATLLCYVVLCTWHVEV